MTTTVRYHGTIAEHSHGEGDDILFLDAAGGQEHEEQGFGNPLAERIADDLDQHGRYAKVRYWTASEPRTDEQMEEGALRAILGESNAKFHNAYSDITGYLWTDEEINVGGHDLLEELRSHKGRYCLLEITYATEPPTGP